MKKKSICSAILLLIVVMLGEFITSCERRPLEEEYAESALIPVKIDWSYSGITVSEPSGSGNVHRVSLRFFPMDGGEPFERYMELNVVEGSISVPIGEYQVIVYNESYTDSFWEDYLTFTNPDSYSEFAANAVADNATNYPFYEPLSGEKLVSPAIALASWSLDYLLVDDDMVKWTRYADKQTGKRPVNLDTKLKALSSIAMRRLTYNVNVDVWTENLASAQLMQGALRGVAQKVYLASAKTTQDASTHAFNLTSRKWDDAAQVNGTASRSFLSFGRLTETSKYWFNMDVVFTNGTIYEEPILLEVTDQVMEKADYNADINLKLNVRLPLMQGGIQVGNWDDEDIKIE